MKGSRRVKTENDGKLVEIAERLIKLTNKFEALANTRRKVQEDKEEEKDKIERITEKNDKEIENETEKLAATLINKKRMKLLN